MRNLLLFGPFLWFRRVVLWVLILLLLLVLVVYFVANSSLAAKKAIDTFAPDYNISYDAIKGNLFTGFEIVNPQYNDNPLAKKIVFKWNPNTLSNKEIKVTTLHIKEANIEAIMALASSFSSESNTSVEQNSSESLDWIVKLNDVEVSTQAFEMEGIEVSSAHLKSHAIVYEDAQLNIENIELNATTNLSQLDYVGEMQNNQLLGKLILQPKEALYRRYDIPLRTEAIEQIEAEFNASIDDITADIHTQGKQILQAKEGAFNVDIDSFDSHVVYDIPSSAVIADTKIRLSTPYAKDINVTNHLSFDKEFHHEGKVFVSRLIGVDAKFVKPLENLEIEYYGDDKGIDSTFISTAFKGYFESKDFKMADAHVETVEPLALATMLTLPAELNTTKAHVVIDAPLDLKDFSHIVAHVKVDSNVVNMDANVSYAEAIQVDANVVIPQNSLLKGYSQDVAWDTLSPIHTTLEVKDDTLVVGLDAQTLKSNVVYHLDTGKIKGQVDVSGLVIDIDGSTHDKLAIKTKIDSVKALGEKLNRLYNIGELPVLEGAIDASIHVDKLKTMELVVTAPTLTYKADRKTKHIINDVKLVASMREDIILLKAYQVTYNKQKFFSTKTAKIKLGEQIHISNFWLNDELKIEGDYVTESKQGNFTAKAKSFHIKDKMLDIKTQIDMAAVLDGNDTRVEGKVVLLQGTITPQIEGRTFATDSDIVILQEIHANKESPFMENLSLLVNIETSKPLLVKQIGLHAKIKPNLTLSKEKNMDLLYLGSIDLLEGSSYIFQEKKFILGKSAVYFTGNIQKPILDIKAKYKALNHLITIGITGNPTEPNINFSSNPSLSREQILSLILFDSETDGDTHSGNEMMRMMGGAMAKAALSDVGVKIDHLAFGEGNSVEVGKKLTSKVTVIYINEEVPKVKMKYKHGKRTESVIGVSEESQSYDIVYKRDF